MNILFLDIDGVLATQKMVYATGKSDFDPINCRLLLQFLKKYNYRIVLSSDWRLGSYESYRVRVKEICPELLDYDTGLMTPYMVGKTRESEIETWLEENTEFYRVEKYIILDDMKLKFDDPDIQERFIQIFNYFDGFGAVDYERLTRIA